MGSRGDKLGEGSERQVLYFGFSLCVCEQVKLRVYFVVSYLSCCELFKNMQFEIGIVPDQA